MCAYPGSSEPPTDLVKMALFRNVGEVDSEYELVRELVDVVQYTRHLIVEGPSDQKMVLRLCVSL